MYENQSYLTKTSKNKKTKNKTLKNFNNSIYYHRTQVPASKDVLDTLPVIKFTEETATGECAICKCDWEKGDQGIDLPCHHIFHKDCIKKWFETSNLCPMCRYEMPTDDPEYEAKRREKQAEQERNGSQRAQTSTAPSSSANAPTVDLTQSQQALLDETIPIHSDTEDSLDDAEDLFSANGESDENSDDSTSIATETNANPTNQSTYETSQSPPSEQDSSLELD